MRSLSPMLRLLVRSIPLRSNLALASLVLGGLLSSATALADEDLLPSEDIEPALVRSPAASLSGVYYPLAPGQTLSFDVVGPASFMVYVRQRLPASGGDALPASFTVLGDGAPIPEAIGLEVSSTRDPGSAVLDVAGGVPGVPAERDINLPMDGAHVLGVRHVGGARPLLVKVVRIDKLTVGEALVDGVTDEDPLGALLAEAGAVSVGEATPAEPAAGAPAPTEPTVEQPAADPWAPQTVDAQPAAVAGPPEPLGVAATSTPAPPPEPIAAPAPQSDKPGLSYGVRLGLGPAAAASSLSGYIGLEARMPLSESLGLSFALGRYGIRYNQELAVQPAIGGLDASTAEALSWTTRVRPLEVAARYQKPIGGDVVGYGSAGLATYFSTRIDEDTRTRGLSLGTTWALGMDIPIGAGTLSPSLSVNTGRRGFDNASASGDEARERLRTGRLNTAYLVSF